MSVNNTPEGLWQDACRDPTCLQKWLLSKFYCNKITNLSFSIFILLRFKFTLKFMVLFFHGGGETSAPSPLHPRSEGRGVFLITLLFTVRIHWNKNKYFSEYLHWVVQKMAQSWRVYFNCCLQEANQDVALKIDVIADVSINILLVMRTGPHWTSQVRVSALDGQKIGPPLTGILVCQSLDQTGIKPTDKVSDHPCSSSPHHYILPRKFQVDIFNSLGDTAF